MSVTERLTESYIRLIKSGRIQIEQVPLKFRENVEAQIDKIYSNLGALE